MSIGIIRKIDELGRIVIPIEIRKNLNIKNGDNVSILTHNNEIILKKYEKAKTLIDVSKKYFEIFSKIYTVDLWITDKNNFIYSTLNHFNGKPINDNIKSLICERKKSLDFTLNILFGNEKFEIIMLPIIIDGEVIGSLLMNFYNNLDDSNRLIKLLLSLIIYEMC